MSFAVTAQPEATARRRGFGCGLSAIMLILGLLAGAALVVFGAQKFSPTWFDSGEQEITSETIGASFTSVAELSVEEYNFTNVGKFSEDNSRLFGVEVPLTGSSFLITYDGTVRAGIRNFEAVDVSIDDAAQTIRINAPDVEVLSSSIDPASVEQFDQSFNPVNQIQVSDMAGFLAAEEDRAKNNAVEAGLLTRAETRSDELLTKHVEALVEGSNLADYTVEMK